MCISMSYNFHLKSLWSYGNWQKRENFDQDVCCRAGVASMGLRGGGRGLPRSRHLCRGHGRWTSIRGRPRHRWPRLPPRRLRSEWTGGPATRRHLQARPHQRLRRCLRVLRRRRHIPQSCRSHRRLQMAAITRNQVGNEKKYLLLVESTPSAICIACSVPFVFPPRSEGKSFIIDTSSRQ